MNSHIKKTLIISAALCLSVKAQSILSLQYPLGIDTRAASGMALNMGGTSIGIEDDNNILLGNPANLGAIKKTAFSSLFSIDGIRIVDNGHHTNHASVSPKQISFAFPLDLFGTVAFSFSKQTDGTVKFSYDSTLGYNYNGKVSFHREGGLTNWQVGWGLSLGKKVRIGCAYQRLYLTFKNTRLVELVNFNNADTRDSSRVVSRGNGLRAGILWHPVHELTVGFSFDYTFEGSIKKSAGIYRNDEALTLSGKEVDTSYSADISIPPALGMGLSYILSPEWLVGIDLCGVAWKYFSSGGLLQEKNIRNTVSLSSGAQFIPAPNLLAPKYWETIFYRAGLRYSQLPSRKSSEFSFSIGTGLPLAGGGMLDLILECGIRNDGNYPDYKENFGKFAIGINGGRTWSKSSKGDY